MDEEIDRMNTPIEGNYYPIHEACKTNNIVAVKHLLPHVNLNICSPIGTPLMIACRNYYTELIDLLIDRVDLSVKDEDGNIFLHSLVIFPDPRERLTHYGKYMIVKNNEGVRPLDILMRMKRVTMNIISSLPSIYFYSGHGCDTGIERVVPLNCMYVTLALCGDVKMTNTLGPFFTIDPDLLIDPIKNKRVIEKYLGMPIQIYKPGDSYSDVYYIPPLYTDTDKSCYTSGLHNIYLKKYFSYETNVKNFKNTFKYSLYPKITDVPDISSWEEMGKIKKLLISQSKLFKQFEGVYYNFSCRAPCNEFSNRHVALRRQKSITRRIAEGTIKTVDQLREVDTPTLYEWIDDPGILFHAPKDALRELPEDKQSLLIPSKFIGGKRKSRKRRIK